MRFQILLVTLGVFFGPVAWSQGTPPEEPASATVENKDQDQPEVLTRGPVHEAFAEQVAQNPQPGIAINQKPPQPIDEIAPEHKPQGENVIWIPGYWFWDDERKDFLWISGAWRAKPPGRRWVPGYWHQENETYTWVSGFWGPDQIEEVPIQELPPDSLDVGPNSQPPSTDHFWVPGCWQWGQSQYRWRPGYWHRHQADWIWVPARYCWTPRGSVYVRGYWDYRLSHRGHLYAPVYFNRACRIRPGFVYRPHILIRAGGLSVHLFVRPSHGHYYFGDYYDHRYRDHHIIPSHVYHARRGCYDPLFTFNSHHFRTLGINFYQRAHQRHEHYVNHPEHRPAHRMSHQLNRRTETRRNATSDLIGQTIGDLLDRPEGRSVERISSARHQLHQQAGHDLRSLADARRHQAARRRNPGLDDHAEHQQEELAVANRKAADQVLKLRKTVPSTSDHHSRGPKPDLDRVVRRQNEAALKDNHHETAKRPATDAAKVLRERMEQRRKELADARQAKASERTRSNQVRTDHHESAAHKTADSIGSNDASKIGPNRPQAREISDRLRKQLEKQGSRIERPTARVSLAKDPRSQVPQKTPTTKPYGPQRDPSASRDRLRTAADHANRAGAVPQSKIPSSQPQPRGSAANPASRTAREMGPKPQPRGSAANPASRSSAVSRTQPQPRSSAPKPASRSSSSTRPKPQPRGSAANPASRSSSARQSSGASGSARSSGSSSAPRRSSSASRPQPSPRGSASNPASRSSSARQSSGASGSTRSSSSSSAGRRSSSASSRQSTPRSSRSSSGAKSGGQSGKSGPK